MQVRDAYDYTDALIKKLQTADKLLNVSIEFKDIQNNAERIKFLEKLLVDNNLIPKIQDFFNPKNTQKSTNYRIEGNERFKNRDFLNALLCYNKSLSYAEENDENVGLSFANRSAIYCEMRLYKRAIKNIDLAVKNNYPQQNIDKLMNRKKLCQDSIKDDAEQALMVAQGEEYLKMSYESNPNVPFIANCLKLKSDERFGRYIVTDRDLSAGDIIAIEEPFSKALLPKGAHVYCAACLSDNFLDLFPCKNCSAVMFCSEECIRIGMKKFHQYECRIIDVLNAINTKIMRIANFTFYEAFYLFDMDIEQLRVAMSENENSPMTVFDVDLEISPTNSKKQMFKAIDSLITNQNNRSSSDLFQRAGIVALMTHFLLNYTDLKLVLDSDDKKDFYRNFLMKQTQISALNYHGIFDGILSKVDLDKDTQFGSGSYPFCSLINHSCAPNIARISYKCKNYIMINRSVSAGEQIFDNYGYHHCLETLRERQISLQNQYMFKCLCEACRHDFKLFPQLKNVMKTSVINENDFAELQNLNLSTARKRFNEFCETLNMLEKKGFYPCAEISTLQECLLRCFLIFKMSKFNLKLIKTIR